MTEVRGCGAAGLRGCGAGGFTWWLMAAWLGYVTSARGITSWARGTIPSPSGLLRRNAESLKPEAKRQRSCGDAGLRGCRLDAVDEV